MASFSKSLHRNSFHLQFLSKAPNSGQTESRFIYYELKALKAIIITINSVPLQSSFRPFFVAPFLSFVALFPFRLSSINSFLLTWTSSFEASRR